MHAMTSIYDRVRIASENRARLVAFLVYVEELLPLRCVEARLTPCNRRHFAGDPQGALAASLATSWTARDEKSGHDFRDNLAASQSVYAAFLRFDGLEGVPISLSAAVDSPSQSSPPIETPDHFGEIPLVVSSRSKDYGLWTGTLANLHPSVLRLPAPPTIGRSDAAKIPAFAHDLLASILMRANIASRAQDQHADMVSIYRPADVLQALNRIAPTLDGPDNRSISSFLSETLITGGRSRGPQMIPINDSRRLKTALGPIERLYRDLKTRDPLNKSLVGWVPGVGDYDIREPSLQKLGSLSKDPARQVWDADRAVAIEFESIKRFPYPHISEELSHHLSL